VLYYTENSFSSVAKIHTFFNARLFTVTNLKNRNCVLCAIRWKKVSGIRIFVLLPPVTEDQNAGVYFHARKDWLVVGWSGRTCRRSPPCRHKNGHQSVTEVEHVQLVVHGQPEVGLLVRPASPETFHEMFEVDHVRWVIVLVKVQVLHLKQAFPDLLYWTDFHLVHNFLRWSGELSV
jgi:hypothetical protein